MRVNTNVTALNALESNTHTNTKIKNSLEKLASGLRVNKASDDASGLAIADKLRTQATSVNQSIANGNSAVALLQIADKSMAEQSNILDTVKAKLIQANTDTTSTAGRNAIAKDVTKLLHQLDNIAKQTNYNGTALLQKHMNDKASGRAASEGLSFQIGEKPSDLISTKQLKANTSGYNLIDVLTTTSLSANSPLSTSPEIFQRSHADKFQVKVDDAITTLNSYRGDIGSTQNQVESAIRNLMTQATNVKAAESVIRDVDYAEESSNFNKLNIISQAGSYAISQANNNPQNVLRLLQ